MELFHSIPNPKIVHIVAAEFIYVTDTNLSASRICVRVAVGVHEPPRIDPERFLSMIRFDTRQKLDELPDVQLDS